jgi:hypothetical protein
MTVDQYQTGVIVPPGQAVPAVGAPAEPVYQGPQLAQGVSFLVHGGPKSGKSMLGDTTPGPRLVLDAEAGSRFTRSRKVAWDPMMTPPPVWDGSWDTCVVYVREFRVMAAVERWLQSGQHPFNSLVIDSISEIQQRIIDSLAKGGQMKREHWGTMLTEMTGMVRRFRDLIMHPVKPLWCVFIIAMTKEYKDSGRWRPLLQGASQEYLPYYVDVCGYIWAEPNGNRHLIIGPNAQFETGERVGGRLPWEVVGNDNSSVPGPSASEMIRQIIGA